MVEPVSLRDQLRKCSLEKLKETVFLLRTTSFGSEWPEVDDIKVLKKAIIAAVEDKPNVKRLRAKQRELRKEKRAAMKRRQLRRRLKAGSLIRRSWYRRALLLQPESKREAVRVARVKLYQSAEPLVAQAEMRDREEAAAAVRRRHEWLDELWARMPCWRARRLAYIHALPTDLCEQVFQSRTTEMLRNLADRAGLLPASGPGTRSTLEEDRRQFTAALTEGAAARCARLREQERIKRVEAERKKAQEGPLDEAKLLALSVKELRQWLRDFGINEMGATEKSDLVALILRAAQNRQHQPASDPRDSNLDVSDRVQLHGLRGQAELNGCNGQLMQLDGDRWLVRLEGHLETKKIKPGNLRLRHRPVKLPWNTSSLSLLVRSEGAPKAFVLPCKWDSTCCCFHAHLSIGQDGRPVRFHVLIGGKYDTCLFPDTDGACPFFEHSLCGPGRNSSNLQWIIGQHVLDKTYPGAGVQVRIFVTPDGFAKCLDWVKLEPGDPSDEAWPRCEPFVRADVPAPVRLTKYDSIMICGSWSDWSLQKMQWDGTHFCYSHQIPWFGMDENLERFQFVIDRDWSRVLHPNRADAGPQITYRIVGPDSKGHDRNWAIQGQLGDYYEVRLYVSPFDGGAEYVDWVRISMMEFNAVHRPSRSPLPKFNKVTIIGSWTNWRVMEAMKLDSQGDYFHLLSIGRSGEESFQITLDGQWSLCIHPAKLCIDPSEDYEICGPDDENHGKDWVIGRHKREKPAYRKSFKIRLRIRDGYVEKVDWTPIIS